MTKELKQRWLDALRSGKYMQGQRFLRQHDKYCCMGVLCDIAKIGWTKHKNSIGTVYQCADDSKNVMYPPMTLGLSNLQMMDLAHLNDIYHKSFTEIADWIEANIPCE